MDSQETFVFPSNLFEEPAGAASTLWTCVRSRPRWEKRLADFLQSRRIAHYLPVTVKETYSGRKHRCTSLPLFPGFVFVQGDHTKQSFRESGCVAYVLRPADASQAKALDSQIRAVWRLLLGKASVEPSPAYRAGERVTIASGPLQGVSGIVSGSANARKLVVWIDMLGVGVFVALDPCIQVARTTALAAEPLSKAE